MPGCRSRRFTRRSPARYNAVGNSRKYPPPEHGQLRPIRRTVVIGISSTPSASGRNGTRGASGMPYRSCRIGLMLEL